MTTRLELGYRETKRGEITGRKTVAELDDRMGSHIVDGETIKIGYRRHGITIDASDAETLRDIFKRRDGSNIIAVDTGRKKRGRRDLSDHVVLFVSTGLSR